MHLQSQPAIIAEPPSFYPRCAAASELPTWRPADIVRLGDYCVSPTAINWACKLASWEEQCGAYPNICS